MFDGISRRKQLALAQLVTHVLTETTLEVPLQGVLVHAGLQRNFRQLPLIRITTAILYVPDDQAPSFSPACASRFVR
ncbi:hypothetical protein [Chitinimonas naiadis]